MSPLNINPVESTLHRPSDSAIQINPRTLKRISWGKFVSHGTIPSPQKVVHFAASPAPSRLSPWLISLAYPIGRYFLMPFYFQRIEIEGREFLPATGPVIFAPTHRSRWDAFMIPYAAGHDVTGRHLRFMVTADEMVGCQGWFIRRMGGFPINTHRPAIASLRHGVDLLQAGETLVIFPEGDIFREQELHPLKPGLARLAIQAETSRRATLGVKVVPIHLQYSHPLVPWRCQVKIRIGSPLQVVDYCDRSPKRNAQRLTADLQDSLRKLAENETPL
ncbi:1-acyl-sn-glycerol-3-phosphate acyltransferase [Kovacikia minuta CCNUW1]|uniref:lysophospholipid acyltransferase family protein n=1 Tax=Kovacikia minuta TaxID=2931930 RepID=UPI001CCCF482|nr:lysophospholipid acyltransferase family protein [Kovacikia minuta]UBF26632.1 1-acyl-sn-glycerol-3-phosphate acyltransferase [Kovacikia minuta CCNUW1]